MLTKRSILCGSLLLTLGCGVARFRPPSPDSPHAELLIEVAYYRQVRGEELTEQVLVDGRRIQVPAELDDSRRWMRAIRIEPGTHDVSFHAYFEHPELFLDFERPYVPGCTPNRATSVVLNDCVVNTQPRPNSNWRWTIDAECSKTLRATAKPGESLKAAFRFYGHGQCEVTCERRTRDGTQVSCS